MNHSKQFTQGLWKHLEKPKWLGPNVRDPKLILKSSTNRVLNLRTYFKNMQMQLIFDILYVMIIFLSYFL